MSVPSQLLRTLKALSPEDYNDLARYLEPVLEEAGRNVSEFVTAASGLVHAFDRLRDSKEWALDAHIHDVTNYNAEGGPDYCSTIIKAYEEEFGVTYAHK